MITSKYLDELGVESNKQFTNFVSDFDNRAEEWLKFKAETGVDPRETWNLDDQLAQFIYTRFSAFKELASNAINLEYYKFEYHGKLITQLKAIEIIIEEFGKYLKAGEEDKYKIPQDICILLGEMFPYMWW